jgi:hypothetical protein
LVHSVGDDIRELCGDIKLTFAIRKQPSISNAVVRNRKLSESAPIDFIDIDCQPKSQTCGGKGCKTCPYLFDSNDLIMVNGTTINLDFQLTCRDNSVLYIAQCQLCNKLVQVLKEDTYFGQTVTAMNTRMNGHRSKFVIDKRLLFEKSALSMHCFLVHKENFSMEYFKLGIVRKVRPVELDREESRLINKFRTNIWGLNRIVVTR